MTKTQIAALLQQRKFDPNQEPPKEETVFRIDFQTVGTLGDYILLTGRPKAGKTKFLSGAMAAAVSRTDIFRLNIRLPDEKRRVVHFDTEQGKRSHYNTLDLVRRLMDADRLPDHFESYHFRQDSAAQIVAMVEYFVSTNPDTGIVFLDGLLDTIDSFNDETASKALVNWLKKITEKYNCLVVGVLHRSLSADKSIGHLGSSADRAAQTVLIVEKNKDTKQYILKAEYMRDSDEFAPVAIWYNKDIHLWELTDYIDPATQGPVNKALLKAMPADLELSQHMANVGHIFQRGANQKYSQLVQNIIEVYGVGRDWAKKAITFLQSKNLIFYQDGTYTNQSQAKLFIVDKNK